MVDSGTASTAQIGQYLGNAPLLRRAQLASHVPRTARQRLRGSAFSPSPGRAAPLVNARVAMARCSKDGIAVLTSDPGLALGESAGESSASASGSNPTISPTLSLAMHIRVSQQQLDRSEIGAGFQQVCGKAVPQHVRRNSLGDFRPGRHFPNHHEHGFGGDPSTGAMARKQPTARPAALPVLPQMYRAEPVKASRSDPCAPSLVEHESPYGCCRYRQALKRTSLWNNPFFNRIKELVQILAAASSSVESEAYFHMNTEPR